MALLLSFPKLALDGQDLEKYIFENGNQKCKEWAYHCLLAFCQANITGPALSSSFPDKNSVDGDALETLAIGGERPYPLVKYPWLLVESLRELPENTWAHVRALFLHQKLFENPIESLKIKLFEAIKTCLEDTLGTYGPCILIEAALIMQYYGDQVSSEEYFCRACEACGFKYSLTGILGVRTKHQTFKVSQLQIKVEECDPGGASVKECDNISSKGPAIIDLNDEDYLETAKVDGPNDEGNERKILGDLEKSLLLANATFLLKFYAKDSSITDKVSTIIAKVCETKGDWCLFSGALYLRSQLEASKSRYVERAALQIQALSNQVTEACSKHVDPVSTRIQFSFISPLPFVWELDRLQGFLFAKLGAFKTSLDIFKKCALWEEQASCMVQIGQKQEAIELIQNQLKMDPQNPKLFCLLADVMGDATLYLKSWDVSGQKYGRAMRSYGRYLVQTGRAKEAIDAFEKALAMNGLFEKIWFLLGCCCMEVDDWKRALHAFSRSVSLEPENSEAWNNLAAVHLQLQSSSEALKCLKMAGKHQYDSWKIWSNICRIALQLGEIQEAISAYRRCAEIREKAVDFDLLEAIVGILKGLCRVNPEDPVIKPISRSMDSLFNDVMATWFTDSTKFWYICADYCKMLGRNREEIEFYFKAYRCLSKSFQKNDRKSFAELAECLLMIEDCIERACGDDLFDASNYREQYNLIKQSVLARIQVIEDHFSDLPQYKRLKHTI